MKLILGALAGLTLLVGVTASQPADAAACYMTPYGMHCWHPQYYGYWRRVVRASSAIGARPYWGY